jgi:hypothetical protein
MAGAAKQFGAYVHVTKKDGTSQAFAPGDAVPSWAAKLVGAHVLADAEPDTTEEQPPAAPTTPASTDGVTPDDEKAVADLQAKLAEIGQPTDGSLEELQQRLDEHGE